ncbi:hypothetical protein TNCV_2957261 [Trichonephila clavipes]|nr:hypothetical protein TNCV_2957261 [Trichonephila clavipes]
MTMKAHPKTVQTQAIIKKVKSDPKRKSTVQRFIAEKLKMSSGTFIKTSLRETAPKNTEWTLENLLKRNGVKLTWQY